MAEILSLFIILLIGYLFVRIIWQMLKTALDIFFGLVSLGILAILALTIITILLSL